MAAEPGHLFRCDRAEKAHKSGEKTAEFVNEHTDTEKLGWMDIEWVDENGITRKMLICPECAAKYKAIASTHAKDMREFEEEGIW